MSGSVVMSLIFVMNLEISIAAVLLAALYRNNRRARSLLQGIKIDKNHRDSRIVSFYHRDSRIVSFCNTWF